MRPGLTGDPMGSNVIDNQLLFNPGFNHHDNILNAHWSRPHLPAQLGRNHSSISSFDFI
jgi:hypothetical protein